MPNEEINLSTALNEINQIKSDLGTALNNQGMTVTDEFSSYPTAVNNRSTRMLQFPAHNNETIVGLANKPLNLNMQVQVAPGVQDQAKNIWTNTSGYITKITANNDLALEKMTSYVGTDLSTASGLQYNTNGTSLTLANNNTQLSLGDIVEGWVQYQITDNTTKDNYYINVLGKKIDVNRDFEDFSITSGETDVERGNIVPGIYENISLTGITQVKKAGTISSTVLTLTGQPYYNNQNINLAASGDMCLPDPTHPGRYIQKYCPQWLADNVDSLYYITLESSDTSIATITTSYDGDRDMGYEVNYRLEVLEAGEFYIYVKGYDSSDNIIFTIPVYCQGQAAGGEFIYDGSDSSTPIDVQVELTYSENDGYSWTGMQPSFSINLDTSFQTEYDINSVSNWTPDISSQSITSDSDNDCPINAVSTLGDIMALEDSGMIDVPSGLSDGDSITRSYSLTFEANDQDPDANIQALVGTTITFYVNYTFTITESGA